MSQMHKLEVDSYHTVIVQQLSAARCFEKVPQANGAKGRICWSLCAHLANTLLGAWQILAIPSKFIHLAKVLCTRPLEVISFFWGDMNSVEYQSDRSPCVLDKSSDSLGDLKHISCIHIHIHSVALKRSCNWLLILIVVHFDA